MYPGYLVTDIGFPAANFGVRNIVLVVVQWTLQIVRIVREKQLLSNDVTYREYMSRVRYRLVHGMVQLSCAAHVASLTYRTGQRGQAFTRLVTLTVPMPVAKFQPAPVPYAFE